MSSVDAPARAVATATIAEKVCPPNSLITSLKRSQPHISSWYGNDSLGNEKRQVWRLVRAKLLTLAFLLFRVGDTIQCPMNSRTVQVLPCKP